MKIEYISFEDGDKVYKEEIRLYLDDTFVDIKYTIREGEPEDMVFGRDLESLYSINRMLQKVYQAGLEGKEIEFIMKDIQDEY